MRWSLRNQVMLPVAGLAIFIVLGVTALNTYLAGARAKQHIESRLRNVIDTLASASFPLTDGVLSRMRGLSGAEFVVVDATGAITAASREKHAFPDPLPASNAPSDPESALLVNPIRIAGRPYYHSVCALRPAEGAATHIHVLFPEQSYRDAWRAAAFPPLAIGGAGLVLAAVMSAGIASRVSRPVHQLRNHVNQIAEGDFQPLSLAGRNDELLDLSKAVNRMAERLSQYERDVRRNEQLRTLGQLGGGIAHQLRNSVTGCRMALDLHKRACSAADHESLEVAMRQLSLMEEFLRRFLALGQKTPPICETVDLCSLIEETGRLVEPAARHAGVDLQWKAPSATFTVKGDRLALQQLLINLLLNALEAASRVEQESADEAGAAEKHHSLRGARRVIVEMDRDAGGNTRLHVKDSGSGPAENLHDDIFEPLVSDKPDGVGLGLAVARDVAEQHGGRISWQRTSGMTCFTVLLPSIVEDSCHAEVASR